MGTVQVPTSGVGPSGPEPAWAVISRPAAYGGATAAGHNWSLTGQLRPPPGADFGSRPPLGLTHSLVALRRAQPIVPAPRAPLAASFSRSSIALPQPAVAYREHGRRPRPPASAAPSEAFRASAFDRLVRSNGKTACCAAPFRDGPCVTDDQPQGALVAPCGHAARRVRPAGNPRLLPAALRAFQVARLGRAHTERYMRQPPGSLHRRRCSSVSRHGYPADLSVRPA